MQRAKIIDILSEKMAGEWGTDPRNGKSVKVLRTTNFTNEGKLNLGSVVERDIDEFLDPGHSARQRPKDAGTECQAHCEFV